MKDIKLTLPACVGSSKEHNLACFGVEVHVLGRDETEEMSITEAYKVCKELSLAVSLNALTFYGSFAL